MSERPVLKGDGRKPLLALALVLFAGAALVGAGGHGLAPDVCYMEAGYRSDGSLQVICVGTCSGGGDCRARFTSGAAVSSYECFCDRRRVFDPWCDPQVLQYHEPGPDQFEILCVRIDCAGECLPDYDLPDAPSTRIVCPCPL